MTLLSPPVPSPHAYPSGAVAATGFSCILFALPLCASSVASFSGSKRRYNVLSSSTEVSGNVFIAVLLSIIKYAGLIGQISLLEGYFDLLNDLTMKWDLGTSDARLLYLEVSKALESQGLEVKSQRFLIKYLATFGWVRNGNHSKRLLNLSPHTRIFLTDTLDPRRRRPILNALA